MIHNEFLSNGWESWEFFKSHNDEVLHTYIKNNEAIIFKSLIDFYEYTEQGNPNIKRIYCSIDELPEIYSIFDDINEEYDKMDFNILKKYKNDRGLLEHELQHCRQFYRTLGIHAVLYKLSANYRYKAELECYRVQLRYAKSSFTAVKYFTKYLTTRYNLKLDAATVEKDLKR
jgi:hypothetical protein